MGHGKLLIQQFVGSAREKRLLLVQMWFSRWGFLMFCPPTTEFVHELLILKVSI